MHQIPNTFVSLCAIIITRAIRTRSTVRSRTLPRCQESRQSETVPDLAVLLAHPPSVQVVRLVAHVSWEKEKKKKKKRKHHASGRESPVLVQQVTTTQTQRSFRTAHILEVSWRTLAYKQVSAHLAQRVSPGEERHEQLCGQALCDLVCYYGALCDAHERSQGPEQRCGRGRVGGQEACGERLQRPEACRNVELRGAHQQLLYTLAIVVSAWGTRVRGTRTSKRSACS